MCLRYLNGVECVQVWELIRRALCAAVEWMRIAPLSHVCKFEAPRFSRRMRVTHAMQYHRWRFEAIELVQIHAACCKLRRRLPHGEVPDILTAVVIGYRHYFRCSVAFSSVLGVLEAHTRTMIRHHRHN